MNKKTLWYILLAVVAVGVIVSLKADKSGMNGSATMYDAIYPPTQPTEPIYPPADYYIYPPTDPIYPPTGYIYPPTDPIYPPADPYTGYVAPTTDYYIYPPY